MFNGKFGGGVKISIHAPREGSDDRHRPRPGLVKIISIHAPREGSDLGAISRGEFPSLFLSTLPARGATSAMISSSANA